MSRRWTELTVVRTLFVGISCVGTATTVLGLRNLQQRRIQSANHSFNILIRPTWFLPKHDFFCAVCNTWMAANTRPEIKIVNRSVYAENERHENDADLLLYEAYNMRNVGTANDRPFS